MIRQSLLLTCVAVAGCTYLDQPGPLPVRRQGLHIVRSVPPSGARQVGLRSALTVYLNVAPAPESIGASDVRLQTGTTEVTGEVRVDLLDRSLRFTPREPLRPELEYRLLVSHQVRGLDGSSFERSQLLELTTGSRTNDDPPESPPLRAPSAIELQPLWNARCAAGCHEGASARARLDLSSPSAARASLRGVRSTELPALLRVAPGDHARSYLIRKLLAEHGFVGLPMPPSDATRLSPLELRQVADWIDGGAE